MSDLSQDELTILMIAAEGESMMPIGRWEKPLDSLVAKGFMHRHDKFNVVITPAGRQACKETEDGNIRGLIEANNTMVTGKETARRNAEAIAVQLVDLSELSSKLTGDDKVEALRRWSKIILTRALELMR